jgi:hypothetical protein
MYDQRSLMIATPAGGRPSVNPVSMTRHLLRAVEPSAVLALVALAFAGPMRFLDRFADAADDVWEPFLRDDLPYDPAPQASTPSAA